MPARRSPLMRGPGPQRKTRLRARSKKKQREHTAYVAFVKQRLAESPWCEVCPVIFDEIRQTLPDPGWVYHTADGLHHRRKRSDQGAVISVQNTVRCCNWANGWIEDNPRLVRETPSLRHLCVRQGDPEWEKLGRKAK